MRAPDNLKGHYEAMVIQPIEYIQMNDLDFCSGNIVKYASRWNKKGDPIGDLTKIIDYARILIMQQEKELALTPAPLDPANPAVWTRLVGRAKLKGVSRELAMNCAPLSYNNESKTLRVALSVDLFHLVKESRLYQIKNKIGDLLAEGDLTIQIQTYSPKHLTADDKHLYSNPIYLIKESVQEDADVKPMVYAHVGQSNN